MLRGFLNSWDLTAPDILTMCQILQDKGDELSNNSDESPDDRTNFPSLALSFFLHNPYESDVPCGQYDGFWNHLKGPKEHDSAATEHFLETSCNTLEFEPIAMFRTVEAQPLLQRTVFQHYVLVKVLPLCSSKITVAAWISMLEGRLQKLKERKFPLSTFW